MKAYTDIEQSKNLAEILPLESADIFYNEEPDETYPKDIVDTKYPMVIRGEQKHYLEEYGIPCWSLAALLEVMPKQLGRYTLTFYWCDDSWCCSYIDDGSEIKETSSANNPVDATVEMIVKLKEKDLL